MFLNNLVAIRQHSLASLRFDQSTQSPAQSPLVVCLVVSLSSRKSPGMSLIPSLQNEKCLEGEEITERSRTKFIFMFFSAHSLLLQLIKS